MPDVDPRVKDPRLIDLLASVEGLQLDRIEGKTFEDAVIFADGRHFRRCTFRRCRIILKLGAFGFVDCDFDMETIRFEAEGPAALLSEIFHMAQRPAP